MISKKEFYDFIRLRFKITIITTLDVYLISLLYVTLLTQNDYVYGDAINLDLFHTIILMWESGNIELILLNILGNLILFFPLGFILPFLYEKANHLVSSILIGFCVSLMIEVLQYKVANRVFDVDDLVLNTL
jgi:glycopeptide antibiotics resistance protein